MRTTVGVEAHTHEFIATAHEDQKFGFSLAGGAAKEAARRVLESDTLELVGLHSHIGSQIFDTAGFEVSAHRVVGLLREIRDDFGVELPELDLGGGVGVAYVPADDPPEIAYIAAQLRDIIERECDAAALTRPRLTVEPGRAICGPSTFTLYEVGTIKPIEVGAGVVRTYVSVDGGMSDNIRTALYDATYSCTVANRASAAPPVLSRVVGQALRVGRHRGARHLPAGRRDGRRSGRRTRHRRVLPLAGQQLQLPRAAAGRRGPRRRRQGDRAARDDRRPPSAGRRVTCTG